MNGHWYKWGVSVVTHTSRVAPQIICKDISTHSYFGSHIDFLEDPGPQAVIYYVGSEYQLSCAVPGSYHIIWAVFNTPRNRELLTSSDSDVELLRLYGFRVGTFDNDTEYRSRLMVNPTVRQSVSYIECVSWDVSTGAQSRGQRIHVVIDGMLIRVKSIAISCSPYPLLQNLYRGSSLR